VVVVVAAAPVAAGAEAQVPQAAAVQSLGSLQTRAAPRLTAGAVAHQLPSLLDKPLPAAHSEGEHAVRYLALGSCFHPEPSLEHNLGWGY
jgi:hypothetical protein